MSGAPKFCIECGGRLAIVREEGHTRRRCRRCGWTFYGNPVPAAVALIMRGGRLLLTRRARPPYAGTWDLPGGFLEAGERPEACVRRELREELALGIRQARLVDFALDRYGPKGILVLTLVSTAGNPVPGDRVSRAAAVRAALGQRQVTPGSGR